MIFSPVFEASSLTKKFGDVVALKSVTLSLEAHRVIGLVGRNGADAAVSVGAIQI